MPAPASAPLPVVLVTNEDEQATWNRVRPLLRSTSAARIRLAISYIFDSGAQLIAPVIRRQVRRGVSVEILFGDDFALSESRALKRLHRAGARLWVYRGDRPFHAKVWTIRNANNRGSVLVGSANLSGGALQQGRNVELGILVDASQDFLDLLDRWWERLHDAAESVDDDFIDSYKDSERTSAVRLNRTPTGKPSHPRNLRALKRHVQAWQRYVASPQVAGQSQRWRGWYLVPEHGPLDDGKMDELGRTIRAIEATPFYRTNKRIDLNPTATGVDNATRIIRRVGISYARLYTPAQQRDLFIRQQKRYLVRLGMIEEVDPNAFVITARGGDLGATVNAEERREVLSQALSSLTWIVGPKRSWGNIRFFPFITALIDRLPNHRLTHDELGLLVMHSYHPRDLEGIESLVTMLRSLPAAQRARFIRDSYADLERLLDLHAGVNAYTHYLSKVRDLMVAFGNTVELRLVTRPQAADWYLVRR